MSEVTLEFYRTREKPTVIFINDPLNELTDVSVIIIENDLGQTVFNKGSTSPWVWTN